MLQPFWGQEGDEETGTLLLLEMVEELLLLRTEEELLLEEAVLEEDAIFLQMLPLPLQLHPNSIRQFWSQPSPFRPLPSSHCSVPSTLSLPQTAAEEVLEMTEGILLLPPIQ